VNRQTGCTQFAAQVVVLANILMNPTLESAEQDIQLVTDSISIYKGYFGRMPCLFYDSMNIIIDDIRSHLAPIIQNNITKKQFEMASIGFDLAADGSGTIDIGDVLPGFEYDESQFSIFGLDTFNAVSFGEDSSVSFLSA
jgi:hypothetical protein